MAQPALFLPIVDEAGTRTGIVVDIGANRGDWTRITSSYFPRAQFLMVEPQERLKVFSEDLPARPEIRWTTLGVSDQAAHMTLSIPARDDGASFLPPSQHANELIAQIEVEVTTLDALAALENRVPNVVKIDAEGLDMNVLRGASSVLGITELVFIECTVCASGDNSMLTVCEFMGNAGYRPVEITDLNRYSKSGALMLCEMAFLLKSSPLLLKV